MPKGPGNFSAGALIGQRLGCDKTSSHPGRRFHRSAQECRYTGSTDRTDLHQCRILPAEPVSGHLADRGEMVRLQQCQDTQRYFCLCASSGAPEKTQTVLRSWHHLTPFPFRDSGNPLIAEPTNFEFLTPIVSGVRRESGNASLHSVTAPCWNRLSLSLSLYLSRL